MLSGASDLESEALDGDGGVEVVDATPDPARPDAGSTVIGAPDATVVDGCGRDGCFTLPSEFQLVAVGPKDTSCPEGFTQPTNVVGDPKVSAGACSCGCMIAQQPSCPNQGAIGGAFGTGGAGTCPIPGGGVENLGCGVDGFLGPFGLGNEHKYTPPGPVGGRCRGAPSSDRSKLSYGIERLVCAAAIVPKCDALVCAPIVPAPFQICVGAPGDVACPSDYPQKQLIGSSAAYSCSDGCSCGVSATCTGKLRFYDTTDCTGAVKYEVVADNRCVDTVAAGAIFMSHDYVANAPTNVSCNPTGSTTASTPTLEQLSTVCCK